MKRRLMGAGLAVLCMVVGVGSGISQSQSQAPKTAAPGAQAGAQQRLTAGQGQPLMAGAFFKNVQVLRNMPVDEFMGTMGFIAASLSLNCLDCHVNEAAEDYAKWAEDTPIKVTARKMLVMVNNINKENFGGQRMVTCYSCHRSDNRPKDTPSLEEQYGMPPPPDPNDVEIIGPLGPGAPTADQLLNRYLTALGGAGKLGGLKSWVGKGTYAGYDTDFGKVPAEMYAAAPGQFSIVAHLAGGDNATVYDGKNAWKAELNTQLPIDALTGGILDSVRLDGEMSFPGGIRGYVTRWRAGFPPVTIGEQEVQVADGRAPNGSRVKFFFDSKTGLLVRTTLFANTAVGLNPTEVDYGDYREVDGYKLPFHITMVWTDGKSDFELNQIQTNVAVDAAKFAKPNPPQHFIP